MEDEARVSLFHSEVQEKLTKDLDKAAELLDEAVDRRAGELAAAFDKELMDEGLNHKIAEIAAFDKALAAAAEELAPKGALAHGPRPTPPARNPRKVARLRTRAARRRNR